MACSRRGGDQRFAVGKSTDALALPFPVVGDVSTVRAPLAGVVGALRVASYDVCVVLPVDCALVTARLLRELAAACADAGVTKTGPLRGAYRRRALPALERRLREGRLALHDALGELVVERIAANVNELVNINTPEDVHALRRRQHEAPRKDQSCWRTPGSLGACFICSSSDPSSARRPFILRPSGSTVSPCASSSSAANAP